MTAPLATPVPLRRAMPDAEVIRLLAQLSIARLSSAKPTVEQLRRAWQLCVKAFATREQVGAVTERTIERGDGKMLTIRMYAPRAMAGQRDRPAMLWIHGGGFVFGDLYTAGATARKLANECQCVVVTVAYRLAPEASIAKGLADCLTTFRWLNDHAADLDIDARRIAVGGDSAGGALAALVAQRCVAADGPAPCAQLLAYPATNLASHYIDSQLDPMPDRMLADLFRMLQTRIARRELDDPAMSPIRAMRDPLGIPTILLTAGYDPLRDEALAFADRLTMQGDRVRVFHYPGQLHGFLSFDAVLSGARLAFQQMGTAMRAVFAGEEVQTGAETNDRDFLRSWSWSWLDPAQRFREAIVTLLVARELLPARWNGASR